MFRLEDEHKSEVPNSSTQKFDEAIEKENNVEANKKDDSGNNLFILVRSPMVHDLFMT